MTTLLFELKTSELIRQLLECNSEVYDYMIKILVKAYSYIACILHQHKILVHIKIVLSTYSEINYQVSLSLSASVG